MALAVDEYDQESGTFIDKEDLTDTDIIRFIAPARLIIRGLPMILSVPAGPGEPIIPNVTWARITNSGGTIEVPGEQVLEWMNTLSSAAMTKALIPEDTIEAELLGIPELMLNFAGATWSSLTSLKIGDDISLTGISGLHNKDNQLPALTDVTFPITMTEIPKNCFTQVTQQFDEWGDFYEVTYPNKVIKKVTALGATSLGENAFRECTSIEEVNAPEVVRIKKYALAFCSNLL